MSRPWMPIYWGDYLRDTRHLTRAQHGSYLLLIAHYWTTGNLPDDDAQLANIAGATPAEWKTDKRVLQPLFHDGWKHKRIDRELRHNMEVREKRRAAGEKGNMVIAMNRMRRR